MTKNKIYETPQLEEVALDVEGAVLAASGENITWGDEFDPWN